VSCGAFLEASHRDPVGLLTPRVARKLVAAAVAAVKVLAAPHTQHRCRIVLSPCQRKGEFQQPLSSCPNKSEAEERSYAGVNETAHMQPYGNIWSIFFGRLFLFITFVFVWIFQRKTLRNFSLRQSNVFLKITCFNASVTLDKPFLLQLFFNGRMRRCVPG